MEKTFKYNVGMFGTCADPLHIGHVATIITAAAQCRKFYVVLSYSPHRDRAPVSVRRKWLEHEVGFLSNVEIVLLKDSAVTKNEYDDPSSDYWKTGADEVHEKTGPVDAIWCGPERRDNYAAVYPEAEVIVCERIGDISSTAIWSHPFSCWDSIPDCVKPFFNLKVLVIGHESCGKSTLVRNLASIYNTIGVQEYGREVCQAAGGTEFMDNADYEEILFGHAVQITEAAKKANKVLFLDTDAYTTSWFARFSPFLCGREWYVEHTEYLQPFVPRYDLVVFLEPDVPFVQDGLRSEDNNTQDNRKLISDQLYKFYEKCLPAETDIVRVGGTYSERLKTVVGLVDRLMEAYI